MSRQPRALGVKDSRIIFRHILPNALAPVFVTATLGVASAILIEASLSFLGFGVQPPAPSWGNILTEGRTYIFDSWWLTVFPGLAILIAVLSFNLVGEGLRDALDPRLRGKAIIMLSGPWSITNCQLSMIGEDINKMQEK